MRQVPQHRAAGLVRYRCQVIDPKQASEPCLRDRAIPAKGAVLLERPTLCVRGGRTDEVSPATRFWPLLVAPIGLREKASHLVVMRVVATSPLSRSRALRSSPCSRSAFARWSPFTLQIMSRFVAARHEPTAAVPDVEMNPPVGACTFPT